METWIDWREDVIAVVKSAAKDPTFPGDADPVGKVLDRLVAKLFGACHNGGEIGKDGCPVCRSWRTEKAEKTAADVQAEKLALGKKIDNLSTNVAELKGTVEELEAQLSDTSKALLEANTDLGAKNAEVSSLADTLNKTATARNEASAKAAVLNDRVNSLTVENTTLKATLAAWNRLATEIKEKS